jgi:hypothetical protein
MDRRLWGAGTKGVVNTAGTKSGAGIGSVAEFSTATIFIDTYPEKRQADQ